MALERAAALQTTMNQAGTGKPRSAQLQQDGPAALHSIWGPQ